MVRRPIRKRPTTAAKKVRGPTIDAARLAVQAIERIRTLLKRIGHSERLGPPALAKELVERERLLGEPLPASYRAAMEVTSAIGAPDRLLAAAQMKAGVSTIVAEGGDDSRIFPFAAGPGLLICFDRNIKDSGGELGIVEFANGTTRFLAASFGEWLDRIADDREETIAHAAAIPDSLRELLNDLGFSFEDPVIGRLETGDVDAIESLLGDERAHQVRGTVNRLFDSSGKASLTLNLDEFTLAVAVRSGIYVFEAADVFRWLRRFRDQDFFKDDTRRKESDSVRDLRVAPREPPLIQRGTVEVHGMPSQRLVFRAASGRSADDFFVLGRTPSMRDESFVLHVVDGDVEEVLQIPEPLTDIYVTAEGTAWGLSHDGKALRFAGGTARPFPLQRPTPGRVAWYGIGGGGDRVLVWGAGALLEFDGERFVPFSPDTSLDPTEAILALAAGQRDITMLVTSEGRGAVARFDGRRWIPIEEDQVIETPLLDLDVWRGMTLLLARDGTALSLGANGRPEPIPWNRRSEAMQLEPGIPRKLHGLRGYDGGTLVASEGGIIAIGSGSPLFFAAASQARPARIDRVGGVVGSQGGAPTESALVAMIGPHLWTWQPEAVTVVDTRST